MALRSYAGGAKATTLNGDITAASTNILVVDGTGYPTGVDGPFAIAISLGDAAEEKVLVASRSGNTLTVDTRGYDGTSAAAHSSGATVDHVLTAIDVREANTHVNDAAGDPHPQYLSEADGNAAYEVTLHRVGAAQFVVGGGAPTLTVVGVLPVWRMDADVEEAVTAFIDIPEQWATYHIDLLWANSGAGTGNVSWRVDNGNVEPGGSITSGFLNAGVQATAEAADVLVSTRLKSDQGAPSAGASSGVGALRIVRQATAAGDTLPNDASIVGLRLTKAS